ncbi:MAG: flippase [Cyanobacteria bacterium P01_G01_bin.49]
MKALDKKPENNLRAFLAKAVAGTFGLQIANAGFGYLNVLLLARFLGAAGYGTYAYAIAWVNLLTIPALLGLKGLIIREVSVYHSKEQWGLAKGLLIWANKIVFIAALTLALLFVSAIWQLAPPSDPQVLTVLWAAIIAIPLSALTRLRQPMMQALNRIVLGQLPELLIRPLLLSLLFGGSYLAFEQHFAPSWAMGMYVTASGVAFLIGSRLLQKSLPPIYQKVPAEYQPRTWLKSALPMLLVGGMYIINNKTDVVMLGMMQDQAEVGIYTVATQGAGLLTFVLIAFNTSLAPTFASLYSQGNLRKLQKIVTKSARMILLAALPLGLGLIIFSTFFLSLFGPEFIQGKDTLSILMIGQLFNAATGSVALLLTMTKHERDVAIGVTTSALLNIILNVVLIPKNGAEGAALATTVSRSLWNIVLVFLAYKRLRIHTTALGKII